MEECSIIGDEKDTSYHRRTAFVGELEIHIFVNDSQVAASLIILKEYPDISRSEHRYRGITPL
jgi:hypothetical protein